MWEPAMITSLAAGIVTIIVAITTAIVSLRTKEILQKDVVVKEKKLDEIYTKVDGRLSKALEEIAQLRSYITKKNGHAAEEVKNDAGAKSAIKAEGVA